MKTSRRHFLAGAAAATLLPVSSRKVFGAAQTFDLRTRLTSFAFDRPETQGLVSLTDNGPPPVIRLKQGEAARLRLTNGLDDYTTMHWHGIRLPNNMDGVPYLTQFPIAKGETFDYTYAPPDAGTYWYHPHCMTMAQMARGLTGVLIVEEPDEIGVDAEVVLNLKDFRLREDGSLLPFFTPRGAARGGTPGNVLTTNWQIAPSYDVPAGGIIRLRIAVTDTTRVYRLVFPQTPGRIIAWDGHPVDEPVDWPTAQSPLWMGPGQRVDALLRIPDQEGAELPLTGLIGHTPNILARLRVVGQSMNRHLSEIKPLPKNPFEPPDLSGAEHREVLFGWTPDGNGTNNGLCGSYEYTFWSIDRAPWPGDAVAGTGPVATLKMGKSYILRLRNESPNLHPIHLHGLVFKPLRSNLRKIPANFTDTLLLLKNEIVDIALRADNPGDWAFHCHVIEHQKTGLSGYVRVE